MSERVALRHATAGSGTKTVTDSEWGLATPLGNPAHLGSDASGSGWRIHGRTADCAPGFMSGYSNESGGCVSL